MAWTDDHCHLDAEDGDATVEAAAAAGVTRLVTVGTDATTSRAAIATAARHEGVWATVGLHPHDAKLGVHTIADLVPAPKVVAVGEAGLDYHYDHSPRPVQREAFAEQVRLASRHGLPLVVHTREAWPDTFAVLADEGVPAAGLVLHCFTGGPEEAERCLALGGHLSFSGIVTFKGAADVRAAAAACPLERLLVETDSPYLAPVPHRGKRNQPAWVPFVGAAVAELQGRDVAEVEAATWANASRVYRLP